MSKHSNGGEREALNLAEVSATIGIGRSKLYEIVRSKRLKVRKIGRRSIVLRSDLQAFLASLPDASEQQ
jgi:excisionase family DNA binding protein